MQRTARFHAVDRDSPEQRSKRYELKRTIRERFPSPIRTLTQYEHSPNTNTHPIRTLTQYEHSPNTNTHQYEHSPNTNTHPIRTLTQYALTQYEHSPNTNTHPIRTLTQYEHSPNTNTHPIRTLTQYEHSPNQYELSANPPTTQVYSSSKSQFRRRLGTQRLDMSSSHLQNSAMKLR